MADTPTPHILELDTIHIGIAFSSDSRRLVGITPGDMSYASEDPTAHGVIWETHTGKALVHFEDTQVSDVAFAPSGRQVVTSNRKNVTFWDAATGKLHRK